MTLQLPPWVSHRLSSPPQFELGTPTSHIERDIILALANLSNNLLLNAASKSLARIKQRHADIFRSPGLFFRAVHLLKSCHYRSTVRSYILELFDMPLTHTMALEVKQAGEAIRASKRVPDEAAQSNRQTIFKLDMDTDSDSSSEEDDEDEIVAPKEMLEPLLVARGFFL